MNFYRCKCTPTNVAEIESRKKEDKDHTYFVKTLTEVYHETVKPDAVFFVLDEEDPMTFDMAFKNGNLNMEKETRDFLDFLQVEAKDITVKEITIYDFFRDSKEAKDAGYISSIEEFWKDQNFPADYSGRSCGDEFVCSHTESKKKLLSIARRKVMISKYEEEIERILSRKKQTKFYGIPIHYMMTPISTETKKTMIVNLIDALYQKQRLLTKRFAIFNLGKRCFDVDDLADYCSFSKGGAVVLEMPSVSESGTWTSCQMENVTDACKVVASQMKETLFIFCFPKEDEEGKKKVMRLLPDTDFFDMTVEQCDKENAVSLLKKMLEKENIKMDDALHNELMNSKTNYSMRELEKIVKQQSRLHLTRDLFPEYKEYYREKKESKKDDTPSMALDELQRMIGLDEVKKMVVNAINYFQVQKELKSRGITMEKPCMHMVFCGNPGTAKTTVARLLAKILKEKGILKVGKLVETSRADLVGKFVGHTAPQVAEKFDEADGSVLFIDEAYSLVDDRTNSFGDEAIHAIVKEMENRRESTVVILAGYQDKMEDFLKRNPGMNSRIAFHINFNDYTEEELFQIAEKELHDKQLTLQEEAKETVKKCLKEAKNDSAFGNGRYVRNLIEKAAMKQSTRLIKKDLSTLTDQELTQLNAEDFEEPSSTTPQKRKIGFCT